MKVLIDTNVLLDTIQEREPFCKDSDRVFDLASEGKIEGCISVQSLKDIFYICRRTYGDDASFRQIEKLSFLFKVIDISGSDSISALMSNIRDYEDSLLLFSARRNNIEAIITRNGRDFLEDMIVIDPKNIDQYVNADVEAGSVIIDNVFDTTCDDSGRIRSKKI